MKKNYQLKSKTSIVLSLVMLVLSFSVKAQLSGIKNIPGDYATLALAVADINLQGVSGPLTINIPAGYTETAPLGGYVLTATGTSVNPIIFQKSGAGANPVLTANTGTATPASPSQDGVFLLVGSDYVTIDGINISDPNTTNPATMEFGYALYKASATDGAQNNTIKNCVVSLNRINNATATAPMIEGSVGIIMMNATNVAATTVLAPTTAAGTNSNNKFYTNTIQNCNYGMALIGYAAATPFTAADFGNDVGGFSPLTGNMILNYGGGAATNPSAAIRTLAQYNLNISFNTINNNNGAGVSHATTLRGIYVNTATSANVAITNNSLTINGGGTTTQVSVIENVAGSTAASNTVAIIGNVISNCTYTTATSAIFYGIYNTASAAVVAINNNAFIGFNYSSSAIAGSGTVYGLYNTGTTPVLALNNNFVSAVNMTGTTGGTFYGVYASSGTNQTINTNTISNVTISGTGTGGIIYGIRGAGTTVTYNNNSVFNLVNAKTTGTGLLYGFYNFGSPSNETCNNNNIYNLTHAGVATVAGLYFNTAAGVRAVVNNTVYAISSGGGTIYGMYMVTSSPTLYNNKLYNISSTGAAAAAHGIYISSGTTINIYNNIVGDIKASTANAANAVNGINLAGGTTANIYNNTVLLNATSSGALFGSSAFNASTGTTLDLRNNIFVNNSTFMGAGISAAYRRSSTTLTSFAATSNNNLFYAGAPSANNAILFDGTNTYSTLATYKIAMATRDQSAISENPNFLSTTGSAANYLHINTTVATAIESGATAISTFSTDIDGDIRFGNTGYAGTGSAYDIGADEFNGISPAPSIDALAITPTGNQCTAVSRNVTATITPGAAPINTVVLNYSFNGVAQTPITMTGGTFTAQSAWLGTIPIGIPTNANVTWNVSTTDGTYFKVTNGVAYKDEPLLGVIAQATASLNPICSGSSATLTASFGNPNIAANYGVMPSASSTSYEDIGNVTFGSLNNTTSAISLVGTLGTATGVAGRNSDFTAFGPFSFTAGTSYPLSVSSLTATGAGVAMGFGVFIDYNRNGVFTDAGEFAYATPSASMLVAPATETASILIPSSALNGLTRMRVVLDEAVITSPTQSVTWGEYEEYMLNISSSNQGGGAVPIFTAYAWNDGTSTVATTSIAVLSPTTNTTYSLTVTDANGCSVVSSPVTVTVVALPSAPLAHNATQCGVGTSPASVTGGTSYNWYSSATSTTVLQAGTPSTYTTSIGATTTFYVASNNGTCLSPRTALTTTVNLPESVMAMASATMICPNTAVMLASTQGTTAVYNFTWTATPSVGSGMTAPITTQTTSVTPTLAGTYVYQVFASDGICATTASVIVTLNDVPSITASANPTMICSGSAVSLNATTPVIATGTGTLGTGSTTSSSGGSPFYHSWGGAKVQYIYTAAELVAQGFSAGNITAMALNVTAVGIPYEGFAINAGTTTQSSFATANTINGLTQVFLGSGVNNSYLPTVGVNTFSFSSPINWNGTDNLVISICWSNATTGGTSSTVKWNTYSSNVGMYIYSDSQTPNTVCSATTTIPASGGSSTTTGRPQTIFTGQIQTQGVGPITWQWNPGAINTNTASINPVNTGTTAVTMVYTITATNTLTTCGNTSTVSVVVNPLPTIPLATNAMQCGLAVPTASVSGGTSYNWYASATATTALQMGAANHYTTAIGATTAWYVSSFNGTCESPRVMVTQSVTIPDAVSAVSSTSAICPGGSYTLVAVKTGTMNTYSYSWNATPSLGSGMPTTVTGASQVVMPTTVGNYNYVVTAVDGVCTTTASVMVMLNNPPSISASATPTMVCSGSNVMLEAKSIAASAGTSTVGVQTSTDYLGGPYRGGSGSDYKAEWLFTAAELNAAGIQAGNITSISFSVPTGAAGNLVNYTLKMGTTSLSTLSTAYASGLTTVLGPVSYAPVNGLNTHILSTPFNWDGVSNILIDACNDGGAGSSVNTSMITAANNSIYSATSGACGLLTGGTSGKRPVIFFGAQVGTNVTSNMNFVWNPGAINTNTAMVNTVNSGTTAVTITYTATVTNTITGCSNYTTVAVVVNPLPTMPLATNAMQCGLAVPTASVSGGTSYNWYASATATTALQMGAANHYTSVIGATTTWYVASFNGNCEGPRVMVTQSVTIPDAIMASATATAVCPNSMINLMATNTGTTNMYAYTWMAAPALGSGMPTSVTGASTSVMPSVSGTYNYVVTGVDGICTTTAVVSVMVNPVPSIVSSATPSMICSGQSVMLNSLTGNVGMITVGTGTTTTSSTGITPYSSNYEGSREQYLITAAELQALNLAPGNITSLSFNVTALGSGAFAQSNFAIKLAHTSDASLSSAYGTPNGAFTNVYGPATQALPTLGANAYTFATPFNWDGVSNILVDICHDNDITATCTACYSGNSSVSTSTTSYNSVWGSYADNAQSCGVQASSTIFTYNARPNMIFGGVVAQSGPYAYQWNPGAINTNTAMVNPVNTGTAALTMVYTVSVTNTLTGCSSTATNSVIVNPFPIVMATTASSVICANYTTTLSATGATTYSWMPAGGNIANASVTPSATTIYTVVGTTAGCSSTATVQIMTNASPTIQVVSSSTSAICPATSVTLTTSGVATTYTWNPAVSTSSMAVVTPTASSIYTVMAEGAGCVTTKTIAVAVNATTLNATASNTLICLGTTSGVTILASGSAVSYTWSPVVTSNTTTILAVTPTVTTSYVIDGANALGCVTTKTITINVANTPTVTPIAPTSPICVGSTATITSMGTAASYTWSPMGGNAANAVVTLTGTSTYTLDVENNGCLGSSVITLTVNQLPIVNTSATPVIICNGQSSTLSATTTATSYTWSNGANTISTVVTPTVTSGYTLTVNDGMCKASTVITVSVSACIGVEELSANGISVYPNPTTDILNIDVNADLVNASIVNVYDALGKLVISENITNARTTVRTSNLDTGMYFVKIISNNREVSVQKLIKQ